MNVLSSIDQMKERPEHVRKQLALFLAACLTVLIAAAWLAVNLSTGSFAIANTTFNDQAVGEAEANTAGGSGTNLNLAGAAAAEPSTGGPARIDVVGGASGAPVIKPAQGDPTVIPF